MCEYKVSFSSSVNFYLIIRFIGYGGGGGYGGGYGGGGGYSDRGGYDRGGGTSQTRLHRGLNVL